MITEIAAFKQNQRTETSRAVGKYLMYTIYVEPIKTSNVNLHTLYEFNKITEFSKPEEPLKITKLAPSLKEL